MRPEDLDPNLTFETLAVHAGQEPDELTGAVSPPIYQTSTYRQPKVGQPIDDYDYARSKNPTRDRFERAVAALEGAGRGLHSPRAPPRLRRSPSWPGPIPRSSWATTSTAGPSATWRRCVARMA